MASRVPTRPRRLTAFSTPPEHIRTKPDYALGKS